MAAISALAEHPKRLDKIMISNDYNSSGIYAMNMYQLGVPFTQIVDDWLPMYNGNTVFAGLGKDGSMWAAIVEKMFAKWYGNYEHIIGGWMNLAVAALNGSPWDERSHNDNDSEIWNFIREADADHDIITAGSLLTCGGDSQRTPDGIACGHAYSVIQSYQLQRANGETVKLLLMRNPWGAEDYKGKYSDSWSGWT